MEGELHARGGGIRRGWRQAGRRGFEADLHAADRVHHHDVAEIGRPVVVHAHLDIVGGGRNGGEAEVTGGVGGAVQAGVDAGGGAEEEPGAGHADQRLPVAHDAAERARGAGRRNGPQAGVQQADEEEQDERDGPAREISRPPRQSRHVSPPGMSKRVPAG